jgi:hypothetical protein
MGETQNVTCSSSFNSTMKLDHNNPQYRQYLLVIFLSTQHVLPKMTCFGTYVQSSGSIFSYNYSIMYVV